MAAAVASGKGSDSGLVTLAPEVEAPVVCCRRDCSEEDDEAEDAEACRAAGAGAGAAVGAGRGGEPGAFFVSLDFAAPCCSLEELLLVLVRLRAVELGAAPLPMRNVVPVGGFGGTAVRRDGCLAVLAGEAVREEGAEEEPLPRAAERGVWGREGAARFRELERECEAEGAESSKTALHSANVSELQRDLDQT